VAGVLEDADWPTNATLTPEVVDSGRPLGNETNTDGGGVKMDGVIIQLVIWGVWVRECVIGILVFKGRHNGGCTGTLEYDGTVLVEDCRSISDKDVTISNWEGLDVVTLENCFVTDESGTV